MSQLERPPRSARWVRVARWPGPAALAAAAGSGAGARAGAQLRHGLGARTSALRPDFLGRRLGPARGRCRRTRWSRCSTRSCPARCCRRWCWPARLVGAGLGDGPAARRRLAPDRPARGRHGLPVEPVRRGAAADRALADAASATPSLPWLLVHGPALADRRSGSRWPCRYWCRWVRSAPAPDWPPAVALLAAVAGRDRRWLARPGLVLAANAPWLVAGLLHAGAAAPTRRAPRCSRWPARARCRRPWPH